MRFFLCLFYMFHRRYSNCRPLNSARYNRIICQTVENTSFFERLSCILHALAKGYQGYKSNFGFRVPFDREIWQIWDQKSVFGFAERNTPLNYIVSFRVVFKAVLIDCRNIILRKFYNSTHNCVYCVYLKILIC